MNTAHHTPGPWVYRGKNDAVYTTPSTGSPYKYGDFVFRFHDEDGPNGEDLDLILAAPELLDALSEFVDEVSSHKLTETERLQKARAAIAKATGSAA